MASNENVGLKGACLAQHYRICWNSELSSVSGGSALSRAVRVPFLAMWTADWKGLRQRWRDSEDAVLTDT